MYVCPDIYSQVLSFLLWHSTPVTSFREHFHTFICFCSWVDCHISHHKCSSLGNRTRFLPVVYDFWAFPCQMNLALSGNWKLYLLMKLFCAYSSFSFWFLGGFSIQKPKKPWYHYLGLTKMSKNMVALTSYLGISNKNNPVQKVLLHLLAWSPYACLVL